MGATDVVPFIPLEGTTMEDCIVLARALGERVGTELGIPVFLYERAASRSSGFPSSCMSGPPRARSGKTSPTFAAENSRGCATRSAGTGAAFPTTVPNAFIQRPARRRSARGPSSSPTTSTSATSRTCRSRKRWRSPSAASAAACGT
jgi:hypothetical protein